MIKFLQGVALILFAALCIVGIQKYSSFVPEKDAVEDPVTEVEPGNDENVETPEEQAPIIKTFTLTQEPLGVEFTIRYEEGMTWEEFINSEYNEIEPAYNKALFAIIPGGVGGPNIVYVYSQAAGSYMDSFLSTPYQSSKVLLTDTIVSGNYSVTD